MSDFTHSDPIGERTTSVYTATVQDEDGVAIPGTSLSTLTLTLYDQGSRQIINGRSAQSVLGTASPLNGGQVNGSGAFTMIFDPEDNAFVGTGDTEVHVALFRYTYDSATKAGQQRVFFTVVNEPKVTA